MAQYDVIIDQPTLNMDDVPGGGVFCPLADRFSTEIWMDFKENPRRSGRGVRRFGCTAIFHFLAHTFLNLGGQVLRVKLSD